MIMILLFELRRNIGWSLGDSKNVQLSLVDLCVSISEKIDDKARLHSWISRKNVFIENEKCDIDTESKC